MPGGVVPGGLLPGGVLPEAVLCPAVFCKAVLRGSTVIIASMPEEGIFAPMMIYRHITPERDNLVRGSRSS